jgi:small subunit ribosomal protein S13
MVHVLGILLPDLIYARVRAEPRKMLSFINLISHQHALTTFYGVGNATAHRLCARLQIHDRQKVRDLTAAQITELASFLASPSTAPPLRRMPLAPPAFRPPPASTPPETLRNQALAASLPGRPDPLKTLKIEAEARRVVRENIAHQRMIGSYVGKRHAMGLPVRGQNTQSNAKTARKLNRIPRFG